VAGVSELMIRPVDPYDEADLDGFQDVYAAAERAEDPDVGCTPARTARRC
jgi:hypothetical protein